MDNKIVKYITPIILLMAVLTAFMTTSVFAEVDVTDFEGNTNGNAAAKVTDISQNIIGIVQVVGTAAAVVMLVVLGIKYVVASASEKAEIKKSAPIYVVAAVFIFAAVNILAIIQDFAKDVTDVSI